MVSFPEISKENFRNIFKDADVGMSMSLPDGTQIQVNRALCRMLGYSAKELLRINVFDLTCAEDRERTGRFFDEVFAGKRTFFSYRKTYRHKNGSRVWAQTSVIWMNDNRGVPSYCVALIQDLTPQCEVEKRLVARENLYRTLVNNIDLGISLVDADFRIVMVNSTFSKWFGRDIESFPGKFCYHEFEKRSGVCDHCPGVRALKSGRVQEMVSDGVREDGSRFVVRIQAFPLLNGGNGPGQFIEVVQDITRQRQAEEASRISEERFRSIFRNSAASMALGDLDGNLLDVNEAFCRFLDRPRRELLKLQVMDITHPEDLDMTRRVFEKGRKGIQDGQSYEKRYLRGDGSGIWGLTTITWLPGDSPGGRLCVALIQDITARKNAESKVRKFAYFDPLTDLPNRTSLLEHLEQMMKQVSREKKRLALLYFDLDHFKKINDSLGHDVGDQLLKSVANRLNGCLRESDFRARIGGDEFGVVLPRHENSGEISRAARRIMDAMTHPHMVGERELICSISMGITIFPDDGEGVGTLFKNADLAMYEAKNQGRNNFSFFSEELNRKAKARLETEEMLRKALDRDEFILVYQPQVDLTSGRIFGFEALVRWRHPQRGLVKPAEFISLAEETGLIIPLGDWVVREACRQIGAWRSEGLSPPVLSINFSGAQFMQKDFLSHLLGIFREFEVPPGCIGMELTESILMTYLRDPATQLQEAREAGMTLAIDDFGKGYSSLSYLKQFPIDYIKIDRDFVHDLSGDAGSRVIVETIIAMGRSLGMGLIAEGVETREQVDFLIERGCHKIQGNFFSKPLDPEQVTALLGKELVTEVPFGTA